MNILEKIDKHLDEVIRKASGEVPKKMVLTPQMLSKIMKRIEKDVETYPDMFQTIEDIFNAWENGITANYHFFKKGR